MAYSKLLYIAYIYMLIIISHRIYASSSMLIDYKQLLLWFLLNQTKCLGIKQNVYYHWEVAQFKLTIGHTIKKFL